MASAYFEMWLRGRLVRVSGWIEPEDGIAWDGVSPGRRTPSFLAEEVEKLGPTRPLMTWDDSGGIGIVITDEDRLSLTLSKGEWLAIGEAFWDSRPFDPDDHTVYAWREEHPEWDANYDPSPYCYGGHRGPEDCDCGPLAE